MASRIRENRAQYARLQKARETLSDEIQAQPFLQEEIVSTLKAAIAYLDVRSKHLQGQISEEEQAEQVTA